MKTVLFLDDSADFLSLVKIFVERRCECKALTLISYEDFIAHEKAVLESDIAFLDINLGPNSPSGIEAFHWLRKNGYAKPIYFLTGHAKNSPMVLEAEALHDVKVLSKPLPNHELKALLL
ncbi:MAG: response regulator [Bdellovibrionota bacterium]